MEEPIRRIPPHDALAEKAVLGSIMLNSKWVVDIKDIISKEDFYERANGIVFEALVNLYEAEKGADLITVIDMLNSMGVEESIANVKFLGDLQDVVQISTNAVAYADIVREKAILRRLIKASEIISNDCFVANKSTEEIIDIAERQIFEIAQNEHISDYTPIKEITEAVLLRIDELAKNKGHITGISTGFKDLDDKTSGLQKSDLILIAARPSMGKTAFALNIAQHVAMKENVVTAVFSLEMSKEQLVQRMLASSANVSMKSIRDGSVSDSDYAELVNKAVDLANSNIIIDDTSGISVDKLRSKCRKYKIDHNLGLVVIDYLQLMSGNGKDRQSEVSAISRSLKTLARELEIPIIALSQLSRAVEQRKGDHRPMLSDLRESGAIEQDADIVMFIYREDYYEPETEKRNVAEIIIAKQRNGPVGPIELSWNPQYTKFADLYRDKK